MGLARYPPYQPLRVPLIPIQRPIFQILHAYPLPKYFQPSPRPINTSLPSSHEDELQSCRQAFKILTSYYSTLFRHIWGLALQSYLFIMLHRATSLLHLYLGQISGSWLCIYFYKASVYNSSVERSTGWFGDGTGLSFRNPEASRSFSHYSASLSDLLPKLSSQYRLLDF